MRRCRPTDVERFMSLNQKNVESKIGQDRYKPVGDFKRTNAYPARLYQKRETQKDTPRQTRFDSTFQGHHGSHEKKYLRYKV